MYCSVAIRYNNNMKRMTVNRQAILDLLAIDAMGCDLPPHSVANMVTHLSCGHGEYKPAANQIRRTLHDLEAAGLVTHTKVLQPAVAGNLPRLEMMWQRVDLVEEVAVARERQDIARQVTKHLVGFGFFGCPPEPEPFGPGEREALIQRAVAADMPDLVERLSAPIKA